MRNGSVRSLLVLCKIFYQLEQSFPSFRYKSGSGDGSGGDQVKSAFNGLAGGTCVICELADPVSSLSQKVQKTRH